MSSVASLRSAGRARAALFFAVVLAACSDSESAPPTGLSKAELMDPAACQSCHPDHYEEWSRSMHAYAAEDPVFLAMNARGQRETNGALGSFCVQCHAPMALRTGATTDGLNLASLGPSEKGVTCYFCHSIDRVDGTHNAAVHLADDGVLRGGIRDPVETPAHAAAYSPLHDRDRLESGDLCGSCHDIVTPNGLELERTYREWRSTVFGMPGHPGVLSCSQCHMDGRPDVAAKDVPGVALKLRTVHSHAFPAVDVAVTEFPGRELARREVEAMLAQAVQVQLCVESVPNPRILVVLDNAGAGHSFPSGATSDRRLWTEVIAYKGERVLYQSGVLAPGEVVEASPDPDLWLIRDCIFDASGQPVNMFWEAAAKEGNLLPGPVTNDMRDPRFLLTHVPFRFGPTSGLPEVPDRVTLRLRLQPIAQSVLNDLVETGDLDPRFAQDIPTFEVPIIGLRGTTVEWTEASAVADQTYQGRRLTCVSPSGLRGPVDGEPETRSMVECRRR